MNINDNEHIGGAVPDNLAPGANPARAVALDTVSRTNQQLIENLNNIVDQGDPIDYFLGAVFCLFDGYDNTGIWTTGAATVIKLHHGGDAVSGDYLKGVPGLVGALLGLRILGSAVEIIDDTFREWDRSVAEYLQKKRVFEILRATLASLEKLIQELDNHGSQYLQLQVVNDQELPSMKVKLQKHRSKVQRVLESNNFNFAAERPRGKVPHGNILTKLISKLGNLLNSLSDFFRPPNSAAPQEQVPLNPPHLGQQQPIIPDGESPWDVINDLELRMILALYLRHHEGLLAYDKQLLYSTLRQATNGNEDVKARFQSFIAAQAESARITASKELLTQVNAVLKDSTPRERLSIGLLLADYMGTGILAAATGMGVIFSSAGLISLLMPVFMPAVCLTAAVAALVFAVAKVAYEVYKERRHEKINQAINTEAGRHRQFSAINKLRIHAEQLSQRPEAAAPVAGDDVAYPDEFPSPPDPTAKIYTAGALSVFFVSGIGVLVGWWGMVNFSSLVVGISELLGTGVMGLTGGLAIGIPLVGAILATSIYTYKAVLGIYQDHQEEKEKIKEINDNLQAQKSNAQRNENNIHREINQLSKSALLRKYISNYLASPERTANVYQWADYPEQTKKKARARADFFRRIELFVGVDKDAADKPESYYNYLVDYMCKDLVDPLKSEADVIELVTQLKYHMPEQDASYLPDAELSFTDVYAQVTRSSELKLKPAIIRYNAEGNLDHSGNWQRLRGYGSIIANYVFGGLGSLSIGLAIATAFASGPAFPIVAAVMAVAFVGAYIGMEILRENRRQRMHGYELAQAHIEMRDITVQYGLPHPPPVVPNLPANPGGAPRVPVPDNVPDVAAISPEPLPAPAAELVAIPQDPALVFVPELVAYSPEGRAAPPGAPEFAALSAPISEHQPLLAPESPTTPPRPHVRGTAKYLTLGVFSHTSDNEDAFVVRNIGAQFQ
jgi:hypothetical protein